MKKLNGAYVFLIMLGALLTLTELVLSLLNSSLCSSEGCRIVESYLRFDERYMYALGFLFFCALFVAGRREVLGKYSSLLLICALTAEGYLVGFQFFVAHTVCPFCIAVASIVAGLALLKLISGAREPMLVGFCLFILTGSLVGSINASSTPIPSGKYVLIYSRECPHCEEVIRFAKERSIPLTLIEANEVKGALGWMGIDAVPVLVCNDDDGKKIYSGAKTIKAVLTAKNEPSTKGIPAKSMRAGKTPRPAQKVITQKSRPMEIFHQSDETVTYSSMSGYTAASKEEVCSIGKNSTVCE